MRFDFLIAAIAAAAFAAPASAQADVLVNAPSTHAVCGDAIRVGVWAQTRHAEPRARRPHTARDRRTGIVWWSRAVTATSRWRFWSLPSGRGGQCGTTVITYVRAAGPPDRFVVRFRKEGV
jgi:hypothetical protein